MPAGLPIGVLSEPLVHLSHRAVTENLIKTARYAEVQAADAYSIMPWTGLEAAA